MLWNVPSQIAAHGNVATAHCLPYECTKCGRAMCSAPPTTTSSSPSPAASCCVVIAVIISSRVSSLKYAWLGPAVSRWYGSVLFGSVRLARGTDDLVDTTVDAFAFRSSNFEIR